jgi:hypothetical protein
MLAMLAGPSAAWAEVVTGSLAFTATGFPDGAPVDPVSGLVNFSFDNTATFFGAGNGSTQNNAAVHVSLSALNLPGSWTPVLTYVKSGVLGGSPVEDLMAIGHALDGTVVNAGNDDWRVAFSSISTNPSFREFTYGTAAAPGAIFMTFTGTASAVPEPASFSLSAISTLGLVGYGWRRRRAA